jgi:hypothetical protein
MKLGFSTKYKRKKVEKIVTKDFRRGLILLPETASYIKTASSI